jgi:hypothetical protein
MISLSLVSLLTVVGCGDDKDGDSTDKTACDTPNEAESQGKVTKFSGTSATVAFPEATAGSEYVVMPYVLGNLKSVKGADDSKTFNFTVEAAKGNVLGIQPLNQEKFAIKGFAGQKPAALMTDADLEHAKRMVLNRFNPRLPERQSESFWQLVRRIDTAERQRLGLVEAGRSLEEMLRARERAVRTGSAQAKALGAGEGLTLTAGECPSDEIPLLAENGQVASGLDISGATVVDATDFCIVLVDQPTNTTSDEIKTVFTELLKTYKTTVYGNDFAAKSGMTFKPVVAVLDFNDTDKWPAKLKELLGVFSADASADAEMPMLYMPKTITLADAAAAKNTWYATLAHELQHANMDYFRTYASSTKVAEIPELDEGLAHYFEDFFGFGAIGFKDFAGLFLDKWYNELPAIAAGEDGDEKDKRGAGQSLWHYLASQKGGVTFTDGKPTGGDGVSFIRSAVTNSAMSGPEGLATAFGGDWTTTIGNFFGALAIDGSSVCGISSRYKTQTPVEDAKDLLGATATFGFNFNGSYDTKKDRVWDSDRQLTALPRTIEDVPYYAPAPFIYKVVDETAELKIIISQADENAAVSVVKIK